MLRTIILAGLAAFALASCKTTQVDLDGNPGSHHWEVFDKVLFPERVMITFNRTKNAWRNWWVANATYRTHDGKSITCSLDPEAREYEARAWVQEGHFVGWDADGMARWWYGSGDEEGVESIFFNPETGRFHTEYWNGNRWAFWREGWLQDSWPRSMAEACPDLQLPADLPINEAQTSRRMWHMMLQDPDAVIRNETKGWNWPRGNRGKGERYMIRPYSWWKTYERRKLDPPPIGLPEAEQTSQADPEEMTPRQAAEEFAAFARANSGRIFTDKLARRYVLAPNPEGDEVWALDEHDDIVDVGLLRFAEGLRYVDLAWETLPDARNYRHQVGDPLPVTVHDDYHPLFDLAAWIVERDQDIGLPYFGQENVGFRLEPGGTLVARHMLGDIPGRWSLSRGRMVIEVEGVADLAGYRWRRLAQHLGWEPGSA